MGNGVGEAAANETIGSDRLISLTRTDEGRRYFSLDGLRSVVNLTNDDGLEVASYHLDAWGNFRFPTELDSSKNRFAFTGHIWDEETGLYNAKARYFDPKLGRFLTQDSFLGQIDEPPSLHRYAYGWNRPTFYIDPDGHSVTDALKWGANFGVEFTKEFSTRAVETVANVATLGGYGGVKKAYAEGRITATDSMSGVKAYTEGVFNTITLGGGERAVGAYAEGKGAGGIAAEAAWGVGETVLPINEVKTLVDPSKNAWEKAEAIATGTAKLAGLAAGGLAAKNAIAQKLANKAGIVTESATGAEAAMAPTEGVLPAANPVSKVAAAETTAPLPPAGEISQLGRRAGQPVVVSPQEMQAVAKSVRRHVDKLNRRGVGDAGKAFGEAVDAGDYQAAGAIAHNRMFKRLSSVDFRTLSGDRVLINRGRVYPPPGTQALRGHQYRMPDIQYGAPGSQMYRAWDFKGSEGGWPYRDPTGQFADVFDWTGVRATPLYYHWR